MHSCRHRLGPDQRQPSRASTDARSPAPSEPRPAPTWPQPTVTRSQGARHTAPPPAPLGLRFRALLGLGFVPPPEPRPCASIAYALLPAARVPLCRHRADPESSSRSLPSGSPARLARIAPTACRHPHPSMSPPSRSRTHRPPHRAHRAPTSALRPISLLALRRPQGPDWQEPRRMHPFFAECAKKAPFLATSARNACFSRSEWQHPRPMHPFPGAIGRFRIHGARILPPRAFFRVEEPEITHGAKMLPAPPGLSAAAACGPAERALRPAARAWPACRMRPLSSRLCPPRPAPPAISPAFIAAVLHVSCFAARIAPTAPSHPPSRPLRSGRAVDQALPAALVLPTPTHRAHRCALAGTAWAPTRANRAPAPSQPDSGPEPTESRPPMEPSAPIRAPPPAAPHPAARVPLRFW